MKNILLIEDDKNFGQILKDELEEERYTVDLVHDGVEGVLSFIAKAHDFVLLDLKMPRLPGTGALRIIKKLNPFVTAVTFSGNAGSAEMAEAVECGAIECLAKPFEIERLKENSGAVESGVTWGRWGDL